MKGVPTLLEQDERKAQARSAAGKKGAATRKLRARLAKRAAAAAFKP